jgi:hypothetical protein
MKKNVAVFMVVAALVLCVGCPGPVTPPPPTPVVTHLAGSVIDAGTGKPVSGLTVSFGDQSSVTDAQGRFSLELEASQGT